MTLKCLVLKQRPHGFVIKIDYELVDLMDISLNGVAYKYTNFFYGYQERYFKLQNGTISYFLSKEVESEGCRKSHKLTNLTIQTSDDPLRLDIVFADDAWSLKFRNENEYNSWKSALEVFCSVNSFFDNIEVSSSTPNSSACASAASEQNDWQDKSPLSNQDYVALRTMKEILPNKFALVTRMLEDITEQMSESESRLQLANSSGGASKLNLALRNCRYLKQDIIYLKNVLKSITEKVERHQRAEGDEHYLLNLTDAPAMSNFELSRTVTVSSDGMISNMGPDRNELHTLLRKVQNTENNMNSDSKVGSKEDASTEEQLAIHKQEDAERAIKAATGTKNGTEKTPKVADDEEDELWQDALDVSASINSIKTVDDENDTYESINEEVKETPQQDEKQVNRSGIDLMIPTHLLNSNPIYHEIQRITAEQLRHAMAPVFKDKSGTNSWELFYTDGDMLMYRMEDEGEDGIACDPLKALHSVKGVSACEYIDTFFEPSLKQQWDDTLVSTKVVEQLHENTIVIHQLHRRIWPSSQRESLFWSQRVDVSKDREEGALDAYMVCNHSTQWPDVKLMSSSNVRVNLKIAMFCQTFVSDPNKLSSEKSALTRADIYCKIIYVAQIHPGGWVPAAGVRQVAKREYPKFLRQFTAFVEKQVKSSPLSI